MEHTADRAGATAALCATQPDGAVRLDDWGLLEARGEESAAFLNGQLTNSMLGIAPGEARLAGYCSPKGRLLASFVTWQGEPGLIHLACSADLMAPTLKRLSMFVLRARCKLADVSAALPLVGLAGPSAAAWLGEAAARAPAWRSGPGPAGTSGRWISLPAAAGVPRFLWAAPAAEAPPPLPALAADTWRWLEVRSAVPRVVAATVDHFVPQMINLELVGGVDFRKGCYPGQEVVARSQYRGTLKRRMVPMRTTGLLAPGTDVFHASDPGQPAGEVVLAAPAPGGGGLALVEVKLAALSAGSQFSSAGVDMEVTELPYPLPADAT
jgi:hypothetical protein